MPKKARGARAAGEATRASIIEAFSPITNAGRSVKARLAKKLRLSERPRLRRALMSARHPLTALAAAPARAGRASAARILLGPKARLGVKRGQRLHPVKGGPGEGLRMIDRGRALDIKSGKVSGKVVSGRVGGRRYQFERKFRPRGLVGLAAKHPLMAGGAAALAYYLAKNPSAARTAGQLPGAMVPGRHFDPAVLAQFRRQEANESPLARRVWG